MTSAVESPRKRLLIVKFGAIGDCIMAIPGAHAMHQAGYAVDWVCGDAVAPLLALYPWINLHIVDDRTLLHGSKIARLRAVASIWMRLRAQSYDVIATLYYDKRYKLLTLPLRAPRKFLLSKNERATALLPGRHHTDEYARILTGRPDDVTPTQLAPMPPPITPPSPLPPAQGTHRVVLVPGGARNMLRDSSQRRWPVENFVAVAQALLAQGTEVVLAGGPGDGWASAAFAGLAITDRIARLSLPETLGLLCSADLIITPDTGPLHMAGLSSAAVIAIFGPTSPHNFMPQRPNVVALWGGEGFACRPCYDGRELADCSRNLCMEQVTAAMVLDEAATLLAAVGEGREVLPHIRTPQHTPLLQTIQPAQNPSS